MLITQPFYMKGFKTKDQVEIAKGNAFNAAMAFFFTFVVSIVFLIRDARKYTSTVVVGNGSSGGGGGAGDVGGGGGPRQLQNPFTSNRPGTLFHDYDPVDTDTPEEFDRGVFS